MRSVCIDGPGHYLGDPQTLSLMQTEYIYPAVADRTSPKEWAEIGKPTDRQGNRAEEPDPRRSRRPLFDPEVDRAVREKFRIYFNGTSPVRPLMHPGLIKLIGRGSARASLTVHVHCGSVI